MPLVPFQYYDIENEVAAKLATPLDGVAVTSVLFETEAQRKTAQDAARAVNKALVIVAYNGSDFDGSKSTGFMTQQDNMNIVCNVLTNNLRATNGIHNVCRLIKKKLQGFQPANSSRLALKSIEFESRDQETAMWSYNITFTCNKQQVQSFLDGDDDTTEAANLELTTFDDKSINGQSIT